MCRNWSYRTKGRDLYDYIFYLSRDTSVNIELVKEKLIDSNYISRDEEFDLEFLKKLLNKKFKEINYNDAKEDVISFISDIDSLDLWSEQLFIEITKNLK